MKLSIPLRKNPDRFNCYQQIAAHVGGMTLALVRHRPIHWTFHWQGICRAVSTDSTSPEPRVHHSEGIDEHVPQVP